MTARMVQLSLTALVLLSACGRPGDRDVDAREESAAVTASAPPRVMAIELGKQVGANLRVTEAATTFMPRDTMYLAVVTTNAASDSHLSVRWTFQDGAVIDSSGQGVARDAGTTTAVTQFRAMQNQGWAIGRYTLDIWLNDAPVGTREFEVKR